MSPPPTIIEQRIPEACVFSSSIPSLAKAKIVGNIIELKSPMANRLIIENNPSVLIESRMSDMAQRAAIISILEGANLLLRCAPMKRPTIAPPQ